ncbi:MAG: hypothetical protein EZS28_039487 [Streblomastix strix]|uniref:Uncharacterized protein n=1 Tax=Streblomastix strix TaxID=222440 RepID=A0A5J4U318_9EUKA|nr:MAG: hypothetical protein EZS28_039487 [Streblomastix strix]
MRANSYGKSQVPKILYIISNDIARQLTNIPGQDNQRQNYVSQQRGEIWRDEGNQQLSSSPGEIGQCFIISVSPYLISGPPKRCIPTRDETIMSIDGSNLRNDAEMKARTHNMTMKLRQGDNTLHKFDKSNMNIITNYRYRDFGIELHLRI